MKEIISVFILVSMVFISCGNVASAATQEWEPAGFGAGGLFPLIVVDPTETNIVYLGADVSGLYKSTDYGDDLDCNK